MVTILTEGPANSRRIFAAIGLLDQLMDGEH